MLRRLLSAWAGFVYRHHLALLGVLLALTLASGLALGKLELQVDIQALLPDDSRAVQANYEMKESFGADVLVVVLQSDSGPVLRHADLVDILEDLFDGSPLIDHVDATLYGNVPTELLLEWLPLLLEPDELEALAEKVAPAAIRRQVRIDAIDLQGPMVPPLYRQLIVKDPLLQLELLRGRLISSRGGYSLNTSSGYYVSQDESMVLLFVTPTRPSDDVPFAKELLTEVERLHEAALAEYRRELSLPEGAPIPGLSFGVTGLHAITAIESRVLQRDSIRAVAWSLALVLLLFVVTFRRLDAALFVGLPLVAGLLWTLAFTYVVIGHLNLMSTGFAAIVLGLGVDYAIHIYNRYLDHRADGDDPERSIEAATAETGTGVVIGALTTAGAFYALVLYDFRGLREFGFIVGSGVIMSLASMLTLLPALLALRERTSGQFHERTLLPLGTRALAASVAARPRPYLWASIAVTAVLGLAAFNVGWQGRILGDDFSANPALQLREHLRARFQSSPDSLRLLLRSTDLSELGRVGRRAHEALVPLAHSGRIGDLDSIFRYLRSPEQQEQTLERLATDPRLDGDRIRADLEEALVASGFKTRPFEPAMRTIDRAFHPERPLDLRDVAAVAAEQPFLQRYLTEKDGHFTLAFTLSSGLRGFTADDIHGIEQALARRVPGFDADEGGAPVVSFLAGGKILARELRGRMKEGYATVTLAALAYVFGMLTLSFRRPGRILLALTPLLLGITWMLGLMTLGGVDMNVINIPVTAMILGIGIDDAVHVVHSFYTDADRNIRATYRTTGKALVLTTLTTTAGFGSLAFAGHPGLRSMGLLAILGCVCCLVAALVTLPSILALYAGGRADDPEAAGAPPASS
jgi:predicted RND superfamily exporter protein